MCGVRNVSLSYVARKIWVQSETREVPGRDEFDGTEVTDRSLLQNQSLL